MLMAMLMLMALHRHRHGLAMVYYASRDDAAWRRDTLRALHDDTGDSTHQVIAIRLSVIR